MRSQITGMKTHWQDEKRLIQNIRTIKEAQEQLGIEEQQAEREGNLARVAELRYGRSGELERQLEKAKKDLAALQRDKKMLKEEVDDEDIAEVISRWTGIPVSRMLEGERDKAGKNGSNAWANGSSARSWPSKRSPMRCAGRVPASRTPTGPSALLSSWDPPAWARPNWPRPWPFIFDSEQAMVRIDMSEFMEKHSVARLIGAPRATWATTRAATSPRRCGDGPIRWSCSTRSKRPIRKSSTCCCRSWTTAA
jgi:ATP-dependent Clp protease ATP-binding subunit ClpB